MQNDKIQFEKDLLERVLKTPPEILLPEDFADKVALKATHRFAWEQYFKEFLIYFGVVLGIAAISAGMAFLWMKTSWNEWWQLITENTEIIIGINFLLVFILFTDRVLLQYFMYRNSVGGKQV